MISFIASIILLLLGYFIYSRVVEKIFVINNDSKTPATAKNDGIDYVPMKWKRIFLIQLLNIAGLGPIFGAVSGAVWGPVAYLWIVFGCIFAGAVHDYFSGMLSLRHNGVSISEVTDFYLGKLMKQIMRVFSVILLVLVGTVFIKGPADLLENLTDMDNLAWVIIIIIYFIIATLLPIDKIIGRLYPYLGILLFLMALGLLVGILLKGHDIPEVNILNLHPKNIPIFPFLFITIACGAISGFHATQSPLMARCVVEERNGRRVFYGAMIAEGIIALIWAAAAIAFFKDTNSLLQAGSPAVIVYKILNSSLGRVGGFIALLGVVVCPITSGDTAFRSSRLTIADALNLEQKKIMNRLYIAVPLFIIGTSLCFIDFSIIWRYFAWSNQTLATIVLWTSAVFLVKYRRFFLIAFIPAVFMTMVATSYILVAKEGFRIPYWEGIIISAVFTAFVTAVFLLRIKSVRLKKDKEQI